VNCAVQRLQRPGGDMLGARHSPVERQEGSRTAAHQRTQHGLQRDRHLARRKEHYQRYVAAILAPGLRE